MNDYDWADEIALELKRTGHLGAKPVAAALRKAKEESRAAFREIYEVYAGSEGLPCETASEAYLVRLIKQMAGIAASKLDPPA